MELQVSSDGLEADSSLPKSYVARAIRYQRKGFQPQTLLTSLTDSDAFPAHDVAALYHERWELELGYDESGIAGSNRRHSAWENEKGRFCP